MRATLAPPNARRCAGIANFKGLLQRRPSHFLIVRFHDPHRKNRSAQRAVAYGVCASFCCRWWRGNRDCHRRAPAAAGGQCGLRSHVAIERATCDLRPSRRRAAAGSGAVALPPFHQHQFQRHDARRLAALHRAIRRGPHRGAARRRADERSLRQLGDLGRAALRRHRRRGHRARRGNRPLRFGRAHRHHPSHRTRHHRWRRHRRCLGGKPRHGARGRQRWRAERRV